MGVYNKQGESLVPNDFSYLSGKKYFAFGGSITLNSGTKANPVTVAGEVIYGYTQAIEDRYGLVCTNKGLSGHSIIDDYSMIMGLTFTDAALVTIAYGANDGKNNIPIGTRDSSDTTTFAGALGSVIKKICTENPDCRVLVITPIQRLVVHDWGSYTPNANGKTQEDFSQMCIDVANFYATPCADVFHNSGLNEANLGALTHDGVHPLNKGYNRMSNAIVQILDGMFSVRKNF